jgi:nucleoside-diphosphate-sugar epimerase
MVSQFGKHCFCSIEKAQSELGYMPTRTLVQGIHEAWGELHR